MIAALLAVAVLQGQGQGRVAERLDSIVEAAAGRGFHGSVLVIERGQTVLNRGYGFANHATGQRFTPNTLVQIGSNVKDMTKVAILQLVERGRLQLTDSLPQFFRDVPADKRGITVRMLMNHRAGLPLGLAGADQRGVTKAELLREAFALPLGAPPGTAERYSNTGYALLAAIVEERTGVPFDRYVADNILRPAGLTQTGSHLANLDRARIAHGYSGASNEDRGIILDLPHDETGHLYQLRGNGGYLSTPDEMVRFYRAVREGPTLLRDVAHRRMVLPDGPGVQAGSDLVSFFLFGYFPGAGVEIVIASNHAGFRGNQLLREILPALGIQQGGDEGPRVETVATGPAMTTLPDNAMGRTVGAYLEAYNSGDTTAMMRFINERMAPNPEAPPMARRLERYRDMFGNLGRLTIRSVRQTADGLEVTATSAGGETVSLRFFLEPQSPFRVIRLGLQVG